MRKRRRHWREALVVVVSPLASKPSKLRLWAMYPGSATVTTSRSVMHASSRGVATSTTMTIRSQREAQSPLTA